jgi:glutathione synthase/RimK-type ligase-like ATP-grasp enzyme
MSHLLGIYREALYSPGRHASNDTVLLDAVADALQQMNLDVRLVAFEQAARCWKSAPLVFSMCQGPETLTQLKRWERQGAMIINSPVASLNTYRDRLFQILRRAGLQHPKSRLIATHPGIASVDELRGASGVWVKRGKVHATEPGDVQLVRSEREFARVLAEFRSRGIERALIQKHREGDEIKFYGVGPGRFFRWLYPGVHEGFHFDEAHVQQIAERAAFAAGLEIFGGDIVIGRDGRISIIDLNDWPSFAPCRDAAPVAIAAHIKERYDAIQSRDKRVRRVGSRL